jgi:hypothetical protein
VRTGALATTLAALLSVAPATARGDVTSWLSVGGGAAVERNRRTASNDSAGAMTYAIGVGSSPLAPLVVGGLFRGKTLFGLGTDLGIALRLASGGFARGDWGIALEGGALWRSWQGDQYGAWPVQAVVTGGSPWGLQLALGADFANLGPGPSAEGVFVALEVDLLRLTLMRQGSTERWWPNPNPASGRPATARQGAGWTFGGGLASSALIE